MISIASYGTQNELLATKQVPVLMETFTFHLRVARQPYRAKSRISMGVAAVTKKPTRNSQLVSTHTNPAVLEKLVPEAEGLDAGQEKAHCCKQE